jgi:hypothetical protein
MWVRWSKIQSSNTWNILAYGQNPNIGAGAYNVPYSYKIYDKQGILLYENSGVTYIPPSNNFVVFDDNIAIGDKIPGRVDFQFSTSSIIWQKIQGQELGIMTVSKNLVGTDTKPKLFVTLKNTTTKPIKNIESLAILYDADGNAVAFSKTKTDIIDSGATSDIVFTWPDKFGTPILKIDIVSEVMAQ